MDMCLLTVFHTPISSSFQRYQAFASLMTKYNVRENKLRKLKCSNQTVYILQIVRSQTLSELYAGEFYYADTHTSWFHHSYSCHHCYINVSQNIYTCRVL